MLRVFWVHIISDHSFSWKPCNCFLWNNSRGMDSFTWQCKCYVLYVYVSVCSLQAMMGEWVLDEEGESQASPVNNDILDHVLSRLQSMIVRPSTSTPRPLFPRFTIRACMLGKTHAGKTSCLTRISNGRSWCFIIVRVVLEGIVVWYIRTVLTKYPDFLFVNLWESVLGIHVLSPNALIQDALSDYQKEKQAVSDDQKVSQVRKTYLSKYM